jgi:hypothetical protein
MNTSLKKALNNIVDYFNDNLGYFLLNIILFFNLVCNNSFDNYLENFEENVDIDVLPSKTLEYYDYLVDPTKYSVYLSLINLFAINLIQKTETPEGAVIYNNRLIATTFGFFVLKTFVYLCFTDVINIMYNRYKNLRSDLEPERTLVVIGMTFELEILFIVGLLGTMGFLTITSLIVSCGNKFWKLK